MNSLVQQPRQRALTVCIQVLVHGASLTEALDKQLEKIDSDRDKAFCSELCYGFCRYYFVLHGILQKLLQKPLKARDKDVHVVLILGLYQIRFMRVSDHAAVNESVKLLKKVGKDWARGLVNAVLRSYIRQLQSKLESDQAGQDLALSKEEHDAAYPGWLKKRVRDDWNGMASSIFRAGNQQAPMVLRVDLKQRTRAEQLDLLNRMSISARAHSLVEHAIILQKAHPVEQLPGFEEGIVSVQDAAAQLAAELLHCDNGMRVLDACAAPGGKTLHILQSAKQLNLVALDKDQHRLQRVHQNLQRAQLNASVICADAVAVDEWFDGELFDRILLDAPCSASGILRRHPDIRLLRQASDIDKLVQQQKQLLQSLWPLLRTGGKLVYSTCSIFKDENERQVESFIASQDNCIEQPLNTVQWGQQRPYGRQILTGQDEMDGFYYACLAKSEPG